MKLDLTTGQHRPAGEENGGDPWAEGASELVKSVISPYSAAPLRRGQPLDPVGFAGIPRVANACGAFGVGDVELLVGQPNRREVAEEQAQRTGTPAGLREGLAIWNVPSRVDRGSPASLGS